MKIAYLITSFKDLSSVHVVLDLVTVMMNHGHFCKVFYFKENFELEFPCETEKISLFRHKSFTDFDVVHSHGFIPDLYASMHRPSKSSVLYLNTIHSNLHSDYKNAKGKILGNIIAFIHLSLIKRLDMSVCMSKVAVEYYSHFLNKKKLTYSYNTKQVDYSQVVTDQETEIIVKFRQKCEFVCGAICIVSDIKGLDQIVSTLPLLKKCGFIIIGTGPSVSKLHNLAVQLKVIDRILFLGYKSNAYRFLPLFDVFCMPSYSEGCPISLLEAAAYKKAIVTSDIPIFNELFNAGEILTFPLNNIVECSKSITKAYKNAKALGTLAKQRFENCYTLDNFYQRYIEIYSREKGK